MCDHDWSTTGFWSALDDEHAGPGTGLGCVQPLRLECRGCGERRRMACGTARASKCEPCAAVYRGRVGLVAGSGLVVGRDGLFITLTAPGTRPHKRPDGTLCPCTPAGGVDMADWNATLGKRWNRFLRALDRYMGSAEFTYDEGGHRRERLGLRYFKAVEVQKRGALHLHVLLRRADGRAAAIRKKKLRRLALRFGFGHAVDVQAVQPGHAAYVSKYVAKSADDRHSTVVPWRTMKYVKPRDGRFAVDKRSGWIIERSTGEVVGPALRAESAQPTFRTWSAARAWGMGMAHVKAAQQHFVQVLSAVPVWEVGKVQVRTFSEAFGRTLAGVPPRPQLAAA